MNQQHERRRNRLLPSLLIGGGAWYVMTHYMQCVRAAGGTQAYIMRQFWCDSFTDARASRIEIIRLCQGGA